ncbi:hypothetical protein L6J37_18870 [Photobacterium sp. WH77]|uniref:hypothetical protein n=1 Tax=unclassified Photobacterium TaxID=2628852 RepID=UPI001C468FBF|nr:MULTISPECIES: hypothetical protein [unclassified Photobacterium]MBV7263999.1 hypothetical protein [Photobacterium sp. WH24]MCG2838903.1 hypothetical protein [Photobacterium sp. WH77]MCG2846520.1 hypothetical protein [Photobacterium sp. WH80]
MSLADRSPQPAQISTGNAIVITFMSYTWMKAYREGMVAHCQPITQIIDIKHKKNNTDAEESTEKSNTSYVKQLQLHTNIKV